MPARAAANPNTATTLRYLTVGCSLGQLLVASRGQGLRALFLGTSRTALARELKQRFGPATEAPRDPELRCYAASAIRTLEEPARPASLPLDAPGTPFQQRVWQALRRIPAGATCSYGQLAAKLGVPTATRAVANACGANPIAVFVPCHRVLRANGELGGYRWGLATKRDLLARERSG